MAARLLLVFGLLAGVSRGQFHGLAPTDYGRLLYFVTRLRLKGERPPPGSGGDAICRIVEGRIERFTEPPLHPYFHHNPQVSGDGEVVAYTQTYTCIGGSSCIGGPSSSYSPVTVRGQPLSEPLVGKVQVSRNGRYVLNAGRWSASFRPHVFLQLRDLETGEILEVNAWPSSDRQALTSDGRVLGFNLQQPESLVGAGPASSVTSGAGGSRCATFRQQRFRRQRSSMTGASGWSMRPARSTTGATCGLWR